LIFNKSTQKIPIGIPTNISSTSPDLHLNRSGKSFTMFGEGSSHGIIATTAHELFSLIHQLAQKDVKRS
jgi:hypothetical protein